MNIRLCALLLICLSFVACQQIPENVLSSVDNNTFQSSATPRLVSEKTQPPATDLDSLPQTNLSKTSPQSATEIVFKSVDGGQTWQDISAGLPKDMSFTRVLADGNEVLLCTGNALFQTAAAAVVPVWEKESFWDVEISNIFPGRNGPYISSYRHGFFQKIPGASVLLPMHNTLKDKTVRAVLETTDGTVFVGVESGLFKSTDSGKTWKQVFSESGVNSLAATEGVLVCGTYKGLLRSTDGGEHWDWVLTEDGSAFKTGFRDGRFITITQGGKSWRDGTPNRLRYSTDGGLTWQRMDQNLAWASFGSPKEISVSSIQDIYDIKQAGQYLFCSCDVGIFRSSDWGESWEPVFTNGRKMNIELAVSGNVIYAVQVAGC